MKISFSPIKRIFSTQPAVKKEFTALSKTLPYDTVVINKPVLDSRNGIITKVKGTFSKEDLARVDRFIEIFKRLGFDIQDIKQSIVRLVLKDLKKCDFEPVKDSNKVVSDPKKITQEFKTSVIDSTLQLLAIKKLETKGNPYATPTALGSWYETDLGVMNPTFIPSRFTHPRDKAIQLAGSLTAEDLIQIQKQEEKFNSLTDDEIIDKKLKILEKLHKTFTENPSDFIGTFSNRELKSFKKSAIKYDALNNIQTSRGIYTKQIETRLFSTKIPDDLKSGDYIRGIGLVVNKINIKNKAAIIVFSLNENSFNQFIMYDLERLKNADSIAKEKESLISEIQFRHIEDHYLIQSFRNHFPKDYPDAGKIIGLQLMKLLAEKDCKPLKIEALAYGGRKHSPVNYYMHFGFTPVDYTKEEIEKIAKENNGNFPYEKPVHLEIKDFEGLRERIKRFEKIYFS